MSFQLVLNILMPKKYSVCGKTGVRKKSRERPRGRKKEKFTAPGIPKRSPISSTDRARRCFTSVIGREPVFSTWYGRRHLLPKLINFYTQEKRFHLPDTGLQGVKPGPGPGTAVNSIQDNPIHNKISRYMLFQCKEIFSQTCERASSPYKWWGKTDELLKHVALYKDSRRQARRHTFVCSMTKRS